MAMVLVNPALVWLCFKMDSNFAGKIRSLPLAQLIRFGIVGVLSNLAGYLVYLLVTSLGVGPKLAVSLLYPLGMILSFVGQKSWTFNARGGSGKSGLKFILVYALGYVLNFAILVVFVDNLGFAHQLVQAVAVIVVAGFLFIAMKLFVFVEGGR